MFATRQSQEPVNAEANRFLVELEQQFDLMRLRARRASLEQEERRVAEEQESLRNDRHVRSRIIRGPCGQRMDERMLACG
jgi:hypothetical protein